MRIRRLLHLMVRLSVRIRTERTTDRRSSRRLSGNKLRLCNEMSKVWRGVLKTSQDWADLNHNCLHRIAKWQRLRQRPFMVNHMGICTANGPRSPTSPQAPRHSNLESITVPINRVDASRLETCARGIYVTQPIKRWSSQGPLLAPQIPTATHELSGGASVEIRANTNTDMHSAQTKDMVSTTFIEQITSHWQDAFRTSQNRSKAGSFLPLKDNWKLDKNIKSEK